MHQSLYIYWAQGSRMLRMVRFGTILSNLGSKAAQMFQMVSSATVLNQFRAHGRPETPNVTTQVLQNFSFGTYIAPVALQ